MNTTYKLQVMYKGRLVHFDRMSKAPIEEVQKVYDAFYHLCSSYEYYVDGKKEVSDKIIHFLVKR